MDIHIAALGHIILIYIVLANETTVTGHTHRSTHTHYSDFYSASSLQQQSVDIHIAALRHNILIAIVVLAH